MKLSLRKEGQREEYGVRVLGPYGVHAELMDYLLDLPTLPDLVWHIAAGEIHVNTREDTMLLQLALVDYGIPAKYTELIRPEEPYEPLVEPE